AVDAIMRHARVCGPAGEFHAPANGTFVRVDDCHLAGLAHEHHARGRKRLAEFADHRSHTGAANLLVIGEGDVERHLEATCLQVRHHGETAGEISFHVAGTATVELAVALDEVERIAVPNLAR